MTDRLSPAAAALLETFAPGTAQPEHRAHRARLGYPKAHGATLNALRHAGILRWKMGGETSADEPGPFTWLERPAK